MSRGEKQEREAEGRGVKRNEADVKRRVPDEEKQKIEKKKTEENRRLFFTCGGAVSAFTSDCTATVDVSCEELHARVI